MSRIVTVLYHILAVMDSYMSLFVHYNLWWYSEGGNISWVEVNEKLYHRELLLTDFCGH